MADRIDCLLKNKNRNVLAFTIIMDSWNIENIDIFDNEFSPVNLENDKNIQMQDLKSWLGNRCIPNSRDGFERLKNEYRMENPIDLMVAQKGLSISDHFWIDKKPFNAKWEDINFFDNDYNNKFASVVFDTHFKILTNNDDSPNTTLNGAQKKSWIREQGKDYIIKAGFEKAIQEPFNEVYASMVLDVLRFKHIKYELDKIGKTFVSKCLRYTNRDTEYINGNDIKLKYGIQKDLDSIIKLCEKKAISGIKEKFNEMFVTDFLIDNTDRHWNNFGIIRDANTGNWLEFMPLFDHGISVWSTRITINANEPSRSGFWTQGNITNTDNVKNINLKKFLNQNLSENLAEIFEKAFEKYPKKERKQKIKAGILERQKNIMKIF